MQRRERAFRQGLVVCAGLLLDQWVEGRWGRGAGGTKAPENGGSNGFAAALEAGAWPDGFPVEAVTLEEALGAVRELEAAQPEQGRVGARVGTLQALQSPSRAPRALGLSKKADPCTSLDKYGPLQLLEHLQQLHWYKDQVDYRSRTMQQYIA